MPDVDGDTTGPPRTELAPCFPSEQAAETRLNVGGNMIDRLAKLVAYKKAPKATYVLRHPVKGTKALVAAKGAKALVTGRTGLALGAVAAIPIGFWAASRMTSG